MVEKFIPGRQPLDLTTGIIELRAEATPPSSIVAAEFTEKTTLESGLVVEEFDGLTAVDEFVSKIAANLLKTEIPQPIPPQTEYVQTLGGEMKPREISGKPAAVLRIRDRVDAKENVSLGAKLRKQARVGKLQFHGPIKDIKVTFLDPANAFEGQASPTAEPIREDEAAAFIIEGDMHSTGKGKVGSVASRVTMYVHPTTTYDNGSRRLIMLKSKPLNKEETVAAVTALFANSRLQAAMQPFLEG